MKFTTTEQQAILQCFWQLLSANPSDSDSNYIEHEISKDWECKDDNNDMSAMDKVVLKLQLMIKTNPLPWIYCAVKMAPYDAFFIVSKMDIKKKEHFKQMVLRIVNNGGDVQYKTAMAVTLFEKTKVGFCIVPKLCGNAFRNVLE